MPTIKIKATGEVVEGWKDKTYSGEPCYRVQYPHYQIKIYHEDEIEIIK